MNKQVLAFCLGDGHLSKKGTLQIMHCVQQKEYIDYKATFFNKSPKFKDNHGHPSYILEKGIFNAPYNAKEIRKKLYGPLGHKYLSKEIVNEMDLFCFAILYLDDGSLCAKKRNGKIHAYDLVISIYGEQTECQYLIDKLKKEWNLNFTLKYNKGKYSIRCGTKTAREFLSLIRPLIPNFKCFSQTKLKCI